MRSFVHATLLSALLFTNMWASSDHLTLPLKYHIHSGAYTTTLYVGHHHQPLDFIVDTGSANLNLVGNGSICILCVPVVTQATYSPGYHAKGLFNQSFSMHYGTGTGKLTPYIDLVGVTPTQPIATRFSVFTSGNNISNVFGLAYQQIASPYNKPMKPYLDTLIAKMKLPNQFSLQLCQSTGKSQMIIGRDPVIDQLSLAFTPIVSAGFYRVSLRGIVNRDTQKPVVQFLGGAGKQFTIIDSGTTGFIILPDAQANAIKRYLYEHTNQRNQRLNRNFWARNYCLRASEIDRDAFPTLQIWLADAQNPRKSIQLDLRPKDYISSSGCAKGYYRMAFVGGGGQKPGEQIRHPDVVLGTPFMQAHTTVFNREKGVIGFTSNAYCH